MTEFVKPSIDYFELWPLLAVFGVACLGVVVEAFVPRAARYTAQVALALVGLVGALVGVVLVARDVTSYDDGAARGVLAVGGTIAVDGPSLFIWGLVLALAIAGVLLFAFGNVMFVAGAGVRGGRYLGSWPGLTDSLDADLLVTTDYRSVLAEVVTRRFGVSVAQVFPGFAPQPVGVMA